MSKSCCREPAATPRPTRPGKRAANQAASSATNRAGRNGSSRGAGADHTPGHSDSIHDTTCNGDGR